MPGRKRDVAPSSSLSRGRRRLIGGIIAAVLVAALATVLHSVLEAVEERDAASHALSLQIAVNEIVHSAALESLDRQPDSDALARAVVVVNGDREAALHALSTAQIERADSLLDDVGDLGSALIADPAGVTLEEHGHLEIRRLLHLATQNAIADAKRAERSSAASIALAGLALAAAAAWFGAQARNRQVKAQARAAAKSREGQRLQRLLDDSPDALFVVNPDGRITFRSEGAGLLLTPDTRSLTNVSHLRVDGDAASFADHLKGADGSRPSETFLLQKADGDIGWFDVRVSDLTTDLLVAGHMITAREITTEVELRRELETQATTDALTGLPNRRALAPAVEAARARMEESGELMALLAVDIDGFKEVNDTLGHLAGDELLKMVAHRLRNAVGPEATLLRMGGDEFAVVLSGLDDVGAARSVAERLREVLDEPFQLGNRLEYMHTSIGLASATAAADVDQLLARADVAMYEAKRLSGSSVVVYEPALEETTTRINQLSRALREIDHDRELSLVYQPIVTVDDCRLVGLEALLRWNSPDFGPVRPDEFIPLAEVNGEICRIGMWVVNQACHQIAVWDEAGLDPDVLVSVNVSARQLVDDDFVDQVLETAAKWNVSPSRLCVEVTETAALDNTGLAQQRLQQFQDAGVTISIDDFGSGYSNLGQLIAVPFDIIKVDRSLLLTLTAMREKAGGDPTGPCAIIEAIVSIAGILDAPVVCEGVETELQRASLQASGVALLQGYLTGRPVPPDELPHLVKGHDVGDTVVGGLQVRG